MEHLPLTAKIEKYENFKIAMIWARTLQDMETRQRLLKKIPYLKDNLAVDSSFV